MSNMICTSLNLAQLRYKNQSPLRNKTIFKLWSVNVDEYSDLDLISIFKSLSGIVFVYLTGVTRHCRNVFI